MNLTYYETQTLGQLKKRASQFKPLSGKRIANNIGLPAREKGLEGADMRAIIHSLRLKGYAICASGQGYWLANNKVELLRFINSLEKRIQAQREVVEGLRGIAEKFAEPKTEQEQIMELAQAGIFG